MQHDQHEHFQLRLSSVTALQVFFLGQHPLENKSQRQPRHWGHHCGDDDTEAGIFETSICEHIVVMHLRDSSRQPDSASIVQKCYNQSFAQAFQSGDQSRAKCKIEQKILTDRHAMAICIKDDVNTSCVHCKILHVGRLISSHLWTWPQHRRKHFDEM